MDLFKKMPRGPSISTTPPAVPPPAEGGVLTPYRVEGIWHESGKVRVPDRIQIYMEGGREAHKPGDVIELTRLEASVLGQTVLLTPLVGVAE